MTWRRRTGIATGEGVLNRVVAHLDAKRILAIVEIDDAALDITHLTLAVDDEGCVAVLSADDGVIAPGESLAEVAEALAQEIDSEVTLGDVRALPEGAAEASADPFEQPLGADIAAFADRAVVFTRAEERGIVDIATQVDDVVYSLEHAGGHLLCITEGPVLATLDWEARTRPALIVEHGAAAPSVTAVPAGPPESEPDEAPEDVREAHIYTWGAREVHTPSGGESRLAAAFIDSTMGTGALVGELMRIFPAVDPRAVRAALEGDAGLGSVIEALHLPAVLVEFLESETDAADLPGAAEVHPASFARSVRRVVTGAQLSVAERAEAMRERAVAVRTRAETAFDAAEEFAEEVVLPIRQNWVSPALAVTETALGILALRKARRLGGVGGGALGTGAVLLLGDALVNTVISIAPLVRRRTSLEVRA